MPTLDDALVHLGYDYPDEVIKKEVGRQLNAAIKTLQGAVGADVETLLPNDPRATELVLAYLDDLHANRGTSAKVSNATRRMVQIQELQLVLELRKLREGADA